MKNHPAASEPAGAGRLRRPIKAPPRRAPISWSSVEACVAEVGHAVEAASFRPDCLVALFRGGLVPARLLADYFGVRDLYPLLVRSYAGCRRLPRCI